MNRRWLSVAFLGLVMLTAGCAGFLGGTEPATPVTPVADLEPPAPGVPAPDQADSVGVSVDTARLQAANERARETSTYRLQRTVVVRGPNETMRIERTRLEGTGDDAFERLTVDGGGRLSSVVENGALWTNGTTTWTRTNLSNGRTVTNRLLGSNPSPYGFGGELAGQILAEARFEVSERSDDTGAVLRSRQPFSLNLPLLPLSTGPATNASARLVVDSDGFVSALDLTYDTTFSDRNLTVSISHRLDRGPASVSRPAWIPEKQ